MKLEKRVFYKKVSRRNNPLEPRLWPASLRVNWNYAEIGVIQVLLNGIVFAEFEFLVIDNYEKFKNRWNNLDPAIFEDTKKFKFYKEVSPERVLLDLYPKWKLRCGIFGKASGSKLFKPKTKIEKELYLLIIEPTEDFVRRAVADSEKLDIASSIEEVISKHRNHRPYYTYKLRNGKFAVIYKK